MSSPLLNSTYENENWSRFCELLWYNDDIGMSLDISRMNIDSKDLDSLQPRFTKAFDAMERLENGSIANIDENRQVGHYWLRNPDKAPNANISQRINAEIRLVEDFGNKILSGKTKSPNGKPFTDVLWIGIGGSSLGPLLLVNALQKSDQKLNFHFLDNVDPDGIERILNLINDKLLTTLFVVVSKSGGTPEPRLCMDQARKRLESIGGNWPAQALAITMSNSHLDEQAINESWLKRFDLPDWVGGRTSITSSVGLLVAALIGCNVHDFLKGAREMDIQTRNRKITQNPSALLASAWFMSGEGKGIRDMVILPYRDKLVVFSRYLQQLVMESLGKQVDRDGNIVNQGLSVFGNKGSTDQHAYVQQLRDGLDNFFVTFIEIFNDTKFIFPINSNNPGDFLSGFFQGTRSALTSNGRQSLTISITNLDPFRLGSLIALFERAVGLYAELINVNAYDQPGVEAGKIAASDVLSMQLKIEEFLSDGVPKSIDEISIGIESNLKETIYYITRRLVFNKPNYIYEGNLGSPSQLKIAKK